MADDFVNNFGLLGQVLFKKRNEREARTKLDEALSRELAKIAAQAGYEKEMVDTRERGAKERAEMGETGANSRLDRELTAREKAEQARREQALAQYVLERQANAAELDMKYDAENQLAESKFGRERAFRDREIAAAEAEAKARGYNAATGWITAGEELTDTDRSFLGIPGRSNAPAGPLAGPAKTGRIKLSTPGTATPPTTKPGETPRNPDNAAPQVPVQVAPKPPTADVKLDSASGIGTGLLENIRGNTWGVGPDSKNMQALVEAYLQKSNPAEPPSILDALGKELGYDQRRPSIKK